MSGGNPAATIIHRRGYRNFVGGADYWEALAKLQFEFMLAKGLKPSDKLLDVGCGALRGGRHFIEYLDPGNYYGIDKHIELIIYGVARELTVPRFRQKMPHFVVSDSFEFAKLGSGFTYALAQSLFPSLSAAEIRLCLVRLHEVAADGCQFFATLLKAARPEMETLGTDAGWRPHYIGDWAHPYKQCMMLYMKDEDRIEPAPCFQSEPEGSSALLSEGIGK
jgi:hypothetical protein